MTTSLAIDEDSFLQTAQVLFVINDAVLTKFDAPKDLAKYMEMETRAIFQKETATFWGTLGFYISIFQDRDGVFHAKSTVSAYCIARYLESIGTVKAA